MKTHELKVPNAQTRAAMAESEKMMRRGTARFASADEMSDERRSATDSVSSAFRQLSSMDDLERITLEPGKRAGKPCIRGLRITVYDVLEYLASGMTNEEILADLPDLEPEDIRAALLFAAARERRLVSIPPA